jgi:transposase InsO family protein
MKGVAWTGSPLRGAKSLLVAGERTSSFGLSGESWQEPPPGSRGRPARYSRIFKFLRANQARARPLMESVGNCHDNALCESFFATLERGSLDRRRFRSQQPARLAVFEFIEG